MTGQTKSGGAAENYQRPTRYKRFQSDVSLEDVADLQNLLYAYKAAVKGRKDRRQNYRFALSLGPELMRLRAELLNGTYKPQPPHVFELWCKSGQKLRTISAMQLRDAIVQHAIYQVVYSSFDRTFIYDSYGCRIGKGTHRASKRIRRAICNSPPGSWYLQLDISKYYYNINHDRLREAIAKRIKDERLVNLMMLHVDTARGAGLYVGGMISQLYGALYLDRFDHYCKRVLHIKNYIRYVDDILIIGFSNADCLKLRDISERYLSSVLGLKFSKVKIAPISRGINFCGFRHFPGYALVRKRALRNFGRALRRKNFLSVQACLAHALNAATLRHYLKRIADAWCAADIAHLAPRFKNLIYGA